MTPDQTLMTPDQAAALTTRTTTVPAFAVAPGRGDCEMT